MEVHPSTTTRNGWETTEGIAEGDEVRVAISDGTQTWDLGTVVVPPAAHLDDPDAGAHLHLDRPDVRYRVVGGWKDRPSLAKTRAQTDLSKRPSLKGGERSWQR